MQYCDMTNGEYDHRTGDMAEVQELVRVTQRTILRLSLTERPVHVDQFD